LILHEINLDRNFEEIEIIPIADTHIGSPEHNSDKLQETIDYILAEDNRFAVLNGDIMDCATIHSVSNSYESTLTPHGELKYARKLFEPIKDRILSVNMGNHERRIYRSDDIDLAEELAFSLDCFYQREGVLLKITFGTKPNGKRRVYTIFHIHGFTGSRTVGGKANRLEKLRKIVVADLYIVSHTHQKINFSKSIFLPDLKNNTIQKIQQTFINTGAYLNYGGYGEFKAYDPTELGSPIAKLDAKTKNIKVIS
jgi:predicted phosphodiesterase